MYVLALFNLVLSAALIVGIPIVIIQILGMSDMHLGATQGAMGAGGLLGGILAGAVHEKMKMKDSWILLAACACARFTYGNDINTWHAKPAWLLDDYSDESCNHGCFDNLYRSNADCSAAADAPASFGKNHGGHYGGSKLRPTGRAGSLRCFI